MFSCYWSNWLSRLTPRSWTDHSHPSRSSLLYRVQILFESSGHAGDQVNVIVHTAAHTAFHQRSNGGLLGAGVKKILRLIVAVHRASGQTVLRGPKKRQKTWFRLRQTERERELPMGVCEKVVGVKPTTYLG